MFSLWLFPPKPVRHIAFQTIWLYSWINNYYYYYYYYNNLCILYSLSIAPSVSPSYPFVGFSIFWLYERNACTSFAYWSFCTPLWDFIRRTATFGFYLTNTQPAEFFFHYCRTVFLIIFKVHKFYRKMYPASRGCPIL